MIEGYEFGSRVPVQNVYWFRGGKDSRPAWSELGGILKDRQQFPWRLHTGSDPFGLFGVGDIGYEATGVGLRSLVEPSRREASRDRPHAVQGHSPD